MVPLARSDSGSCGSRGCSRQQLGESKIQDFEPTVASNEQIFRFQIAVDDSFGVGGRQTPRQCSAQGTASPTGLLLAASENAGSRLARVPRPRKGKPSCTPELVIDIGIRA